MLEGAQHIAQPRRTTNKLPAGKPTRSSLAFAGIQHVQESALGPHSCTVAILLRSLLSQSRHQRLDRVEVRKIGRRQLRIGNCDVESRLDSKYESHRAHRSETRVRQRKLARMKLRSG